MSDRLTDQRVFDAVVDTLDNVVRGENFHEWLAGAVVDLVRDAKQQEREHVGAQVSPYLLALRSAVSSADYAEDRADLQALFDLLDSLAVPPPPVAKPRKGSLRADLERFCYGRVTLRTRLRDARRAWRGR